MNNTVFDDVKDDIEEKEIIYSSGSEYDLPFYPFDDEEENKENDNNNNNNTRTRINTNNSFESVSIGEQIESLPIHIKSKTKSKSNGFTPKNNNNNLSLIMNKSNTTNGSSPIGSNSFYTSTYSFTTNYSKDIIDGNETINKIPTLTNFSSQIAEQFKNEAIQNLSSLHNSIINFQSSKYDYQLLGDGKIILIINQLKKSNDITKYSIILKTPGQHKYWMINCESKDFNFKTHNDTEKDLSNKIFINLLLKKWWLILR